MANEHALTERRDSCGRFTTAEKAAAETIKNDRAAARRAQHKKPIEDDSIVFEMRMPDVRGRVCGVTNLDMDVFATLKQLSAMTGMTLPEITCKLLREAFKRVRIIETEDKVCGRCPSQGYSVLQFIRTEVSE